MNGHKEGDANPFAEYMWMENEEEYNRQVSVNLLKRSLSFTDFFFLWRGVLISFL